MMVDGLSVIVPAYNEGPALASTVPEITQALRVLLSEYEILLVNDGSQDETGRIAEILQRENSRIRVHHFSSNRGPGAATLWGIANAAYTHLIYIPADGQFDLRSLKDYLFLAERSEIVIGVRSSYADYDFRRFVASGVYRMLLRILFGLRFKDVNWSHLYRRSIFDKIKVESAGVFMLAEILIKARRCGFGIAQLPTPSLARRAGRSKTFKVRVVAQTIRDMLRCRFKR